MSRLSTLYIGISGVARSGKNLFCDISKKILKEEYGLTCESYALAYALKQDCQEFIHDKLGLDVFSEKTGDKNVFREMLVWYGDCKRKQTEGRYWTEKLQKIIEEKPASDVAFITDIRYDFYKRDEVSWIQHDLNGKLVHVSKYTQGFPSDGRRVREDMNKIKDRVYTEPANHHELLNDPKVKQKSDIQFEWEHVSIPNQSYDSLVNHPELNKQVSEVYQKLIGPKKL